MKRRRLLTIFGFFGVIIGVVVGRPLINSPQTLATPHLEFAKSKTESVVESNLVPVRTFFGDSKKNTRHFAEVALGWGSKWRLIADHAPFTSSSLPRPCLFIFTYLVVGTLVVFFR